MTEETKRDILRDYNDPKNTVKQISEKYGIARAAVAKIAVEMGGATPKRKSIRQTPRHKTQDLPEVQTGC